MTQTHNPQPTESHELIQFDAESACVQIQKLQKPLNELTREDMARIASYSTDTAYALGKQDFQAGCSPRRNPFPLDFMRGVPHTSFASYYQHGRQVAEAMGQASRACRQLTQVDQSLMMAA